MAIQKHLSSESIWLISISNALTLSVREEYENEL